MLRHEMTDPCNSLSLANLRIRAHYIMDTTPHYTSCHTDNQARLCVGREIAVIREKPESGHERDLAVTLF